MHANPLGQVLWSYAASGSAITARAAVRNAPSRHAIRSAIETTATMIVEIALIWGVTPNRIALYI